jgi:hypothetical protein
VDSGAGLGCVLRGGGMRITKFSFDGETFTGELRWTARNYSNRGGLQDVSIEGVANTSLACKLFTRAQNSKPTIVKWGKSGGPFWIDASHEGGRSVSFRGVQAGRVILK